MAKDGEDLKHGLVKTDLKKSSLNFQDVQTVNRKLMSLWWDKFRLEGSGYEAQKTSKMARFSLESRQPCSARSFVLP